MASYGIYNRQNNNVDVIDRPGAKPDRTITRQDKGQKGPEEQENPTPVPPKKPAEPEKPKEQPALTEGENPRAFIPQNTTETGIVRVIQPEGGIVKKPSVEDIEDVEPEQLPSGPTFPALNAHKEEPVFGMTIEDANSYLNLQNNLWKKEKENAKNKGGREAKKLQSEIEGIKYEMNKMRNRLGRPTDEEFENAITAAWRREKIAKLQEELNGVKKDAKEKTEFQRNKKAERIAVLERDIEMLGGEKMLDISNLVYYQPVKGKTREIRESKGKTVKITDEKDYDYSEDNQSRVVAGPLSEKQNIDDERRSNANKKKKTKEVKNNDEKIARFAEAIDKMTDEQKGAIEILMDLINKNSEKRA